MVKYIEKWCDMVKSPYFLDDTLVIPIRRQTIGQATGWTVYILYQFLQDSRYGTIKEDIQRLIDNPLQPNPAEWVMDVEDVLPKVDALSKDDEQALILVKLLKCIIEYIV